MDADEAKRCLKLLFYEENWQHACYERAMTFGLSWRIILLLSLFVARSSAASRVVLMDFSADDKFYHSAVAAADFSTLLQAKLAGLGDVEWIERSQLEVAKDELSLTLGGYVSPATALHVGKFVKANLLINGEFIPQAGNDRALRMEVIDLDRADILTDAMVPIQGPTNRPLTVSVSDITAASEKLSSALQRAIARHARVKTQTAVAPLFFANTSTSRRLDYFETELQAALNDALTANDVRALQFPRTTAAMDEADLGVAGLVEQDQGAWRTVADIYVWGQYEEVNPNSFSFEETPVNFTLNFWDGSGEAQSISETAKVSELPQLKKRLVEKILVVAKSHTKQTASEQARHQVARQLLSRANAVHLMPKPPGETAQGRQMHDYEVRLLGTAHFFAPESYAIHRLWLDSRWATTPRLFKRKMEQIHSYDDFDDNYGLISPAEVHPEFTVTGNWTWSFLIKPRTYSSKLQLQWRLTKDDICNMIDGHDPVCYPTERPPDFPADAPPETLKLWQVQLRDDFARRLFKFYDIAIHASPPIQVPDAHLFLDEAYGITNKQLKAKFVEELWRPIVDTPKIPTARHEYTASEFDYFYTHGLFARLQQVFGDVGQPEKAAAMIEEIKKEIKITDDPDGRIAATAREAQLPLLISVDLLPPQLKPDLRSIVFPSSTANGVVALKNGNGALWVSTRGGAMTMRDRTWEYLTSSQTNASLWRIPLDSQTPELISPKIGAHSKITSLCMQDDQIWLTLEQGGVSRLTSATFKNASFGDKDGVLSRQMFASARAGNRLYFGGGEPGNGKLNCVELPGLVWKALPLANNEQIKILEPLGRHLLANNQILDLNSGGWLPLNCNVLCAAVDSKNFWLGTPRGLLSYDPESSARHEWQSVPGGFYVDANGNSKTNAVPSSRLPGAVTALANDGDFLWVAATTRFDRAHDGNGNEGGWINDYYVLKKISGSIGFSIKWDNWRNTYIMNERHFVLLFHKPTGKWVGYFPITSRATGLAVSDEKLWIGLEDTGYVMKKREVFAPSPLITVQKAALESIPADKWVPDTISAEELQSLMQEAAQILKRNPAST
jgi:hypothetical protein